MTKICLHRDFATTHRGHATIGACATMGACATIGMNMVLNNLWVHVGGEMSCCGSLQHGQEQV